MKKILKIVALYLAAIILSYSSGFLLTNYKLLRSQSEKTINSVDYITYKQDATNANNENSTNAQTVLEFDNSGKYINQFLLNYEADKAFSWTISYDYISPGGSTKTKSIEGSNSQFIGLFAENIKNYPHNFKLIIDGDVDEAKISNARIDNRLVYFGWQFVFCIALCLAATTLIVFRRFIVGKPERLFLVLSLFAGLTMVFMQPLGIRRCSDDWTHINRVYSVVGNKENSQSLGIYSNPFDSEYRMYNTEQESLSYKEIVDQEPFISDYGYGFDLSYSSFGYIGLLIGQLVGITAHLSFSATLTLTLITNVAVYSIIVFFAIKKIPIGKYLLLVVGLTPNILYMSANFSYDPTLMAFMMLGFSYTMYEALHRDTKLCSRNIAIMLLSFAVAFAAKPPYCLFMMLVLALPKDKFISTKACIIFKTAVAGLIALIMGSFLLDSALSGNTLTDSRGGDTSVARQISYVKNHPATFAKAVYYGAKKTPAHLFGHKTFEGLIYQDYPDNDNGYILALFLVGMAIVVECGSVTILKRKTKYAILVACLLTMCAIWGTMYLAFTEVGEYQIAGVGGRYFIPLIFPVLLLLCTDKVKAKISPTTLFWLFAACELFILFNVVYSLLC